MSNYKLTQTLDQFSGNILDCDLSNSESSLNGSSFESDIPLFYCTLQKECNKFVESFQNSYYDSSSITIQNILRLFLENHNSFDSNINVSCFVQIFDSTHFFVVIFNSISSLIDNHELFHNIILFIDEFTRCNDSFCSYLSNTFLFDFVSSLILILDSDIFKTNINIIITILSNLFKHVDPQNFDNYDMLQKLCSITDLFNCYEKFLQQLLDYQQKAKDYQQQQDCQLQLQNHQHKMIIFLGNVIKKMDFDIGLYEFFIQYLLKDNCVNSNTFLDAISIMQCMLKKATDINFFIMLFQSGLFEILSCTYFADEFQLDQKVFPIYMNTIAKLLKFFNIYNFLKVQQPEVWEELILARTDILKQFSRELLYSKLEEIDNRGNSSFHAVIKFISVLLQQGCLMEVFANQKALIYKLLEVYEDVDIKGKEKMLKLFLNLMNYSKFFRNQIFNCDSIDFSESFCDFIDSECEKSISVIIEIVDFSLKYYYKKSQEFLFLANLINSEDFMMALSQGSEETSNEELRVGMQSIFAQLNELSQKISDS